MGAVLRWIFSLISALLWLSFSPRANSYHEALPFHAHRLYKRWEGSSTDGGGWNCRECGSNDSTLSNFSTVSESAQNRTGPLLVHLVRLQPEKVGGANDHTFPCHCTLRRVRRMGTRLCTRMVVARTSLQQSVSMHHFIETSRYLPPTHAHTRTHTCTLGCMHACTHKLVSYPDSLTHTQFLL